MAARYFRHSAPGKPGWDYYDGIWELGEFIFGYEGKEWFAIEWVGGERSLFPHFSNHRKRDEEKGLQGQRVWSTVDHYTECDREGNPLKIQTD